MATIGTLAINLIANTASLTPGLSLARRSMNAFKADVEASRSVLSGFGGVIGSVGAALGAGFTLKTMIGEAAEAESVMTRLQTVLASTGGAAGVTAAEIDKLAGDLQKTTTFSDETTKSAAAVLATFTHIKGDVFIEALKSAQDLSTILGGDLQSNVVMLGRALNDPVNAGKALRKMHIALTESEKAHIKTLVESGHALDAQNMILGKVAASFGGQATAAGKTFAGQMTEMKNLAAELMEQLGAMLLPFLTNAVSFTKAMLDCKFTLQALVAAGSAAAAAFTIYKVAAIGAAIANLALTATIPVVGILAAAAAAGAAAGAIYKMRQSLKESESAGETVAVAIDHAKRVMNDAAIAADTLRESLDKIGDKSLGKAKADFATEGMSEAQKAVFEFLKEVNEELEKQKDAVAKLSAAQKAALVNSIALRAKEIAMIVKSTELAKEQAEANKAVEDARKELANLGKASEAGKKADELREKGFVSQADELERIDKEIQARKQLFDQVKEQFEKEKQHRKEIRDIGQRMFEESFTANEKYRKSIADINQLQKLGAIDATTAQRERAKSFFDFRNASLQQNQPVSFLERGSAEAISAIRASANDPLGKLDETAQKQLTAQLDSLTVQRETHALLKGDKIFDFSGV